MHPQAGVATLIIPHQQRTTIMGSIYLQCLWHRLNKVVRKKTIKSKTLRKEMVVTMVRMTLTLNTSRLTPKETIALAVISSNSRCMNRTWTLASTPQISKTRWRPCTRSLLTHTERQARPLPLAESLSHQTLTGTLRISSLLRGSSLRSTQHTTPETTPMAQLVTIPQCNKPAPI